MKEVPLYVQGETYPGSALPSHITRPRNLITPETEKAAALVRLPVEEFVRVAVENQTIRVLDGELFVFVGERSELAPVLHDVDGLCG